MTEHTNEAPDVWTAVLLGCLFAFTVALFISGAATADPIPTNSTGLILLYQFDDAAAGTFTVENDDADAGTKNMTCSGGPTEADHGFNGTDSPGITFVSSDQCQTGTHANMITETGTIAYWANITACADDGTYDMLHDFSIAVGPNEKIFSQMAPLSCEMRFRMNTQGIITQTYEPGIFYDDVWKHYIITWVKDGNVDFYVNGSLANTLAWTGGGFSTESTPRLAYFGMAREDTAGSSVNGKLDDFGYWSRVITAGEIVSFSTAGNQTGGTGDTSTGDGDTLSVEIGFLDINVLSVIAALLPILMLWSVWKAAIK